MRTPKRRPHEKTELLPLKSANKILASDGLEANLSLFAMKKFTRVSRRVERLLPARWRARAAAPRLSCAGESPDSDLS